MKKKIFAALLCAILGMTLLPATALADGPSAVIVGGTEVSGGEYWRNDGDGGITTENADADNYNILYDPGRGILTLRGATITKNRMWEDDGIPCAAALYTDGALQIDLIDANTLTGVDSPDGSVCEKSIGIYTGRNALTLSGSGSLIATGGKALVSVGLYSAQIALPSGSVTAAGGSAGINSSGVTCAGIEISGGRFTATGGTAVHSLGVSGDSVTLSGGEATLDGGAADGEGSQSIGLCVETVTVSGGKLRATGGTATGKDCQSTGVYCGSIEISDGNVGTTGGTANGEGSQSIGINSNNLTISKGIFTATGGAAAAIYGISVRAGAINVSGGDLTAYGDTRAVKVGSGTECWMNLRLTSQDQVLEGRTSGNLRETDWSGISPFVWVSISGICASSYQRPGGSFTQPSFRVNEVWPVTGEVLDPSGVAVTEGCPLDLDKVAVKNHGVLPGYKIYAENGEHVLSAKKGTQAGSVRVTVNGAALSGQDITLLNITVTSVTVSPETANVIRGGVRQFTAALTGTDVQTVTWSVAGNRSASTSISPEGVLSVGSDETATALTVRATSTVDGTKSGSAVVTVKAGYLVRFDGNGATNPEARYTAEGKLDSLPSVSRSGYSFAGWYTAEGIRVTADTVFTADTTLYARWSRSGGIGFEPDPGTVYRTTEGAGDTWMQGAVRGSSFTFQAPLHKFRSVQVDGRTLDTDDYDRSEGSTIITLHADYLDTLSPGTHILRVNFTDGYAETSFTVIAASFENPNTGGAGSADSGALWTGLLFLSGLAVASVGIPGKRRKVK